ncbi:MAG: tRNA (adenosine(37)-N6)-dimethylallyltransferase MiaA, partial [Bacilli bacterium]|nr:tRNA (adenosine(37)-N6)-dimethylallyltransferase MiaA [Bacilli bacterium]
MSHKVIVLTGPTGVGKTEISLKLAAMFHGEIINADASQVRRKLNIGTAKIDVNTTNIKHHLLDFLDVTENFSIFDYQNMARKQIAELFKNEKVPFLVGGSGLYLNAVLYDYDLSASSRNEEFAQQFAHVSDDDLHKQLQEVDPLAACKIPRNNRRRVLRALEIAMSETKKISTNITKNSPIYDCLLICFNTERSKLYERINNRVEAMFAAGWIKECQDLIADGIELSQIKDIGYQEIGKYLQGLLTLEQVKAMIKQKTRNYAKRQLTWFRNKMECQFITIDYENRED